MSDCAVTVPFLDLPAQHAPIKDKIMALVAEAIDTAGFVGGHNVSGFEEAFGAFVNVSHCVGVSSGTDALRFALLALGIGQGDRVVTAPNTFIATTEAISQVGAQITFVDVQRDTALMSPQRLEELLASLFDTGNKKNRPKAIVPIHLYGQCADMDSIMALADRYELKVIEDAAQAHGASYRGRQAGCLGHAAAFSFYPGKNLGACGEGGAVTTSDPAVAEKIRILRDHGQTAKNVHEIEGYNGRLDAVQAAILQAKLIHLPGWNEARRIHAERFDTAFQNNPAIRPITVRPYGVPSRHLYVIHTARRDSFRENLGKRRIATGMHYPMALHLQPCYARLGYAKGAFPVAEELCGALTSLPMFPEMTEAQVTHVINSVLDERG